MIWKEVTKVLWGVVPGICLQRLWERTQTLRVGGVVAQTRTLDPPEIQEQALTPLPPSSAPLPCMKDPKLTFTFFLRSITSLINVFSNQWMN
jgi:hypothetical protein